MQFSLIAALASVSVVAAGSFFNHQWDDNNDREGSVKLAPGTIVQGLVNQSTQSVSYLNLRYAQAPIGPLRFKLPVAQTVYPSSKTLNIIDGTKPGFACIQSDGGSNSPPASLQSEDCLNLNVYAPLDRDPEHPLSVVVFLYGGSFTSGSANFDLYNGQNVVKRNKNVILVTVNFRVGALGYAASLELAAEGSLNAGLLDQYAALQWVNQNIASFGGNPKDVTLAGESSGAIAIGHHLLAFGGNQTLFQKALLLSGGPILLSQTPQSLESTFTYFAAKLGCTANSPTNTSILTCLRALPASTVFNVGTALNIQYQPVVDGTYIQTEALPQVLLQGKFSKVPIMLTTNADEGSIFGISYGLFNETQALGFEANLLPGLFNSTEIGHLYNYYAAGLYQAPYLQGGDFFADLVFQCPTQLLSEVYTAANVTVFNGRKNYQNEINTRASLNTYVGVYHGSELPFFFLYEANYNPSEQAVVNTFHDSYFNFITTGNPNGQDHNQDHKQLDGPSKPQWPVYGAAQNRFDIGNRTVTPDTDRSAKCEFFRCIIMTKFGLGQYDPSDCLHTLLN